MMMGDFELLGSLSAAATLSSSLRACAVSSTELNSKLMVRSKEPGVRTLAVVVTPRNRRSKNGMLHSGSSAQTISSWLSSSASAGAVLIARERLQSSRYAQFAAVLGV